MWINELDKRVKHLGLETDYDSHYILINDKEAKKYIVEDFEELKLLDPITEDRNTLRNSIIPSLLKIYVNVSWLLKFSNFLILFILV